MQVPTIILAILASATLASSSLRQIKRSDDDGLDAANLGTLKWTGPLAPGEPANTTLYGTAKSVYEQILTLNPDYDPWAFGDFRLKMAANGITREAFEADFAESGATQSSNPAVETLKRRVIWMDCDPGEWVNWDNCGEGLAYMRRLGGGLAQCAVDGAKCTRFSCAWNCGIFLCSNGGYNWANCVDIALDMELLNKYCGRGDDTIGGTRQAKGRINYDDRFFTQLSRQDC